ncbi:hypothetical protein GA0070616_3689 [Micromonospora nigra]|uniref:Uncharacterized protein n=1 Tax=Micromonospora nigra TaxID=145857 RepID=A0A1C6SG62_9ACTN|nr:hypothetical protein [Micromonospora nigra]SCL28417.1 hypothetical protein GA0070616_3689 [Micromonospora nigra]
MPLTEDERDDDEGRPRLEPVPPATGEVPEDQRIARLEREVEELRSANEILRRIARFLAQIPSRRLAEEEAD